MRPKRAVQHHLLDAGVAISLLQPIAVGALGTFLVAAATTHAAAQTLSAESVAKVAQAITVRIEGATQGSGVLVKRDGNRYTVLTAWHVVSGQKNGEELEIYTSDGQRHKLEQGSIKRLDSVDMALLSFSSPNAYELPRVGDAMSVSIGGPIYVAGFPLPSSAVPTRLMRFLKGEVIANATVTIPNGYQLLYSNPTLPGMSGGAVMNAQGQLVGIHAGAERADQISESVGKAVATGTNQAVPIAYYSQYSMGAEVVASSTQAATADDFLSQAKALLERRLDKSDLFDLSNNALEIRESAEGYLYRAYSRHYGLEQLDDINKALAINPKLAEAYIIRGSYKAWIFDKQGAISDFSKAIEINPKAAAAFNNRGHIKFTLGDKRGAFSDFNQAISINPRDATFYFNRGVVKSSLGDEQGAIEDYNKAVALFKDYAQLIGDRFTKLASPW